MLLVAIVGRLRTSVHFGLQVYVQPETQNLSLRRIALIPRKPGPEPGQARSPGSLHCLCTPITHTAESRFQAVALT